MRRLKLYRGRCGYRHGNAGDEVTEHVLRAMGRECEVIEEPERAELIGAGSILHQLPEDWPGLVWGAGCIREDERVRLTRAQVIAVRGPLTERRLEPERGRLVLGEPGLLVSHCWPHGSERRYDLGIVPHYVDRRSDQVTAFARRNFGKVRVIDICDALPEVLRGIAKCRAVLSSSLHGLVFADAYGIPNAWVKLSDEVVGVSFKFRDYHLGTRPGCARHPHGDYRPVPFQGNETLREMVERAEHDWCRIDDLAVVQERLLGALDKALV